MKKITFAVTILLLASFGCKSPKNTTTVKNTYSTDDYLPFLVSYIEEYNIGAVEFRQVYFYNSREIKIDCQESYATSRVVAGGVLQVEKNKEQDLKIVRKGTIGTVKEVFHDDQNGDKVLVSFSKKDPTFRFWFTVMENGTFELLTSEMEATNGKTYDVYTRNCKLMFSQKIHTQTDYKENEAEGDDGT